MINKLQLIYDFLVANTQYNQALQEKEYRKMLCHHKNEQDKALSLLYNIANTQSQPKIDLLANFYQHVIHRADKLGTFEGFVEVSGGKRSHLYKDLFDGLRTRKGWGNKTSALLSKTIFNLHSGQYASDLKIWHDAPETLQGDHIPLPVDAVIIEIFRQLGLDNPAFHSINKEIRKHYSGSDVVVWDDLWFWGFITQKGSGRERVNGWNPNKYWALEHSDKDPQVINEIESKSIAFLKLLS